MDGDGDQGERRGEEMREVVDAHIPFLLIVKHKGKSQAGCRGDHLVIP